MAKKRWTAGAAMLLGVVLGCDGVANPDVDASLAKGGATSRSVSGGGMSEVEGYGATKITFNASVDGGGNVAGSLSGTFATTGAAVSGPATCLVVDGSQAWLGVSITSSSDAGLVGTQMLMRFADGGEGKKATPDKRSLAVVSGSAGSQCSARPDLSLIDWTNGNVQVR